MSAMTAEEGRAVTAWARSQFPYWDGDVDRGGVNDAGARRGAGRHGKARAVERKRAIFMESAGGAQVPRTVVNASVRALSARWREVTRDERNTWHMIYEKNRNT